MHTIIYIMGVSGSGKTTVGKLLAAKISLPFFDGDDLHSSANKKKMESGTPLTDEDRQSWLQNIHALSIQQQQLQGAIVTCSALKEKYRNILSAGIAKPIWIFLQGDFELIKQRMQKRKNHFMPVNLLKSQFNILEVPANAFMVDIHEEAEKITGIILKYLQEKM